MSIKKPSREELLASCSDPGPDDGLDPRAWQKDRSGQVPNRKALQLCGQVARALSSLLAGECGDAVLRELRVESVEPAPTSVRLLVTVSAPAGPQAPTPGEVTRRLHRAAGMLRCEVASAVHRRRAPELLFRVVAR